MSKHINTNTKTSGRPRTISIEEQSIQVILSDKKVKIIRKTDQSIEVINRGKKITINEGKKSEKIFKCNEVMTKQAKAVLKQINKEKKLGIDVDNFNTRSLGMHVINALQAQD